MKTLISNYDMLTKAERDAAKHAVDLAEAEGKSKRDVIKLQEKQLELEKKLAKETPRTYKTTLEQAEDGSWIAKEHDYVEDLEDNRKELAELNDKIEKAKISLGNEKKTKLEDGTKINADYIAALEAERDALQTYVDAGDAYIEMQNQMEVSAAKLAEEKRKLALAEDQANTAAKRTTQDLQTGLMDDKYEQQKKQTRDNYNRQIEDIKTRLKTETDLTKTEREEMDKQIKLLERTRDKELKRIRREHLNEMVQAEADAKDDIIDIQDELANEQTSTMQIEFDKLAREREQRLRKLTQQEESWIKEQGGLIDAEGHYTDTSKLTEKQKEYLAQSREAIDKMYGDGITTFGTKLENTIFESYASGLQKAIREQDRLTEEAAWLQSRGRDTTEVKRQQNEQALAYMQSEEQEINPEFERWVGSLVNFTSEKLEGMLLNAEAYLTKIESDKDTTKKELIEARAIIAALQKQIKEAKADPLKKVDTTKLQRFKKVLGESAKGFRALGQTGNEAFDNIMNDLGEVAELTQSIIDNVMLLAESTAEKIVEVTDGTVQAVEKSAKAGANAVKKVEKASVILAIIGAVLQIAMKVKSLLEGDGTSRMEEIRKAADDLRVAFADLKREMMLDTTRSNTIFGDNAYTKLTQYTDAINTLTGDLETSRRAVRGFFDNFYEYEHKEASGFGRQALSVLTGGIVESSFGGYSETWGANIDKYKDMETTLDDVAHAIENYKISVTDYDNKIQEWWRKTIKGEGEEYKTMKEALKDAGVEYELVGATAEETYQRIKKASETDAFKDNVGEEARAQLDEMLKNYEAYFEAKDSIKEMYSGWFGGLTDAFANSIKTGFEEGMGAGKKEFKDAVNDMVGDMFLQRTIGKNLADTLDDYSTKMSEAQLRGESTDNIAKLATDAANAVLESYDTTLEQYTLLQEKLQEAGFGKADALDGTLSGAIKGASQESIDLLSGYCNAVRIQQVDGINIMREQLISLSGIERNTLNTNTILGTFKTSMENLLTADNVRASGAVLN